jgi:hypothetical protein
VIRAGKKLMELSAILSKRNKVQVSEAIKMLREEEPYEGVIGLLASFYNETEEESIQKTIEEFFNDLKDQSVRTEVITEIRRPWKSNTISMLVASCWQSGLDYSDYLVDMAKIFLKGDFATSIECMTVIEESVQNSSRERKDEIINILMESSLSYINEKAPLTLELITILER